MSIEMAVDVVKSLREALENWVEIADKEDIRQSDLDAIEAAKEFENQHKVGIIKERETEDIYDDDGNFIRVNTIEFALLRCRCGGEVYLSDPLDNECEGCGANYNMSGQSVLHSCDPDVEEPYDYD